MPQSAPSDQRATASVSSAPRPMRLSIVIVNWNTRAYLLKALESIHAQMPDVGWEVIVVDNASHDGSGAAVADRYPGVHLIANGDNAGYARGNNQGIERSSGEFVLLLNPDVVLPPSTLERAMAILSGASNAAALGVRLVGADGVVQRSIRGFPTPLAVACEALGLSRLFPHSRLLASYRMPWFDYDAPSEVDQPMGTFLLIRRAALESIGALDERFPIFFNEVDWCLRARRKGFTILYTPEVEILHYGGASTRQAAPAMAWESRRGLLRFLRKHYPGPQYAPLYWVAVWTSWLYAGWTGIRRSRRSG